MIDLVPVREDLRAQAAATWPECLQENGGGGIIYAEYADQLAWADLDLPYAVLTVDTMPRGSWGQDALAYEVPWDLIYVAACEDEGEEILSRLQALEGVLWPAAPATDPLENGQVLDILGITVSNALPANQTFVASGHPARAGLLRVKVLVE